MTSDIIFTNEELMCAIAKESRKFQECYLWLEKAMPKNFFVEVEREAIFLCAHNLMGFDLQGYFTTINLPNGALVLCLDSEDADVRILDHYRNVGIKNYLTFVSDGPPPFPGVERNLRIAAIYFTEAVETTQIPYPAEAKAELLRQVKELYPQIGDDEFERLITGMNTRFLSALKPERLALALGLFLSAKTRDHCQYEVRYNQDWEENDLPSMQIVLAWRSVPKHDFLYYLARTVMRHGLVMKSVNATYIDPYSPKSILLMAISLHGAGGQAAWDAADIPDFLKEMVTLKYFIEQDHIDPIFVKKRLIGGNYANLLRSMVNFIHQALVNIDPYFYAIEHIEEALCRHPELTVMLCEAFSYKFHPDHKNLDKFQEMREEFLNLVDRLDTGQEANDLRRKNVMKQGMNFIDHTLKTNFYRNNKTAYSFRLDPHYLDHIPFDRKEKFPELPYAIFFARGMHFFGFHIRFKDLARGGIRTVFPEQLEQARAERNNVFTECYNLAYTQQKKNKDIPEGGSKGVIFLRPYDQVESEAAILESELSASGLSAKEVEEKLINFHKEHKVEFLHQAQRSFIESVISIINCEPSGVLRAKHIVDYWKRPEYIYLGPDENMHNETIQWIARYSSKYDYKPRSAFISSKPKYGINHKEYGVTSLGCHTYVEEVLHHLGIDPQKDSFTVKMSGGPDGDVAGNEILNLYNRCPKTAKLIALTDGSGTINDPEGLDLKVLVELFHEGKPIKDYPPEKLSKDAFLLDRNTKRADSAFSQQTLCWRNVDGMIVEDWISGSEMNHLFRHNVHSTHADIFIPAGGRPRTLHSGNIEDYLNEENKPTSKAIVEGANLYLTQDARHFLEELGVLIVKDSSANKGGVICSSFEVLCGLTLGDEKFLEEKEPLVAEILDRLQQCARLEAKLLLATHKETDLPLTEISEIISEHINEYTYEILDHLEKVELPKDPSSPLMRCFLAYALPTLRKNYQKELLEEIPDHHKKAIIACHVAALLVYKKGLDWSPSMADILPLILEDSDINPA